MREECEKRGKRREGKCRWKQERRKQKEEGKLRKKKRKDQLRGKRLNALRIQEKKRCKGGEQ